MTEEFPRRGVVLGLLAGLGATCVALPSRAQDKALYGLIGKIRVAPGQRDKVIEFLLEGTMAMPGCLSYLVALDPADADAIWVTEAWQSKEQHQASLSLPGVQQAIARARPHIVGFGERFETIPVGGQGLGQAK